MRNLKKLLAVVVTLVMVLTLSIPAFAADTATAAPAKTEADICKDLGMVLGSGAGVTPEYLATQPTRLQGAIMFLRLKGLEGAAKAFLGTDNFADVAGLNADNTAILAYLKANPDLGYDGVGDNKFDPNGLMTAKAYYKVLLVALGYKFGTDATADFTWANVFSFAATKGLNKLIDNEKFTVNDLAIGTVEGLKVNPKGGTTNLLASLVTAGTIASDKAVATGLYTVPVAALTATGVTANNLKEITVAFSQALDEDTVTTDNLKLKKDGITVANYTVALQDDKKSVVIKADTDANFVNQAAYTLSLADIKDTAGTKIASTSLDVKPFDNSLPELKSIKVTGPKSLELTFSEPIANAGTRSVSVKTGSITVGVNSAFTGYNSSTIKVSLYTSLTDGKTYTVAVKGFQDYAAYAMVNYSSDVAYAADKSAITASVDKAEQTYVAVKFNKPVTFNGTAINYFYHTFSAWKPLGVYSDSDMTTAVTSATAVDEVWLKFADGDAGYAIAEGTANLVIKSADGDNKIKDNWGNEYAGATLAVTVTADKVAPSVTDLTVEAEDELKVKFDENVVFGTDNIEVLNGDGTKNDDIDLTITGSGKEYTIDLGTSLPGKSIVVNIKNVEDTALAPNKLASFSKTLDITDKTAPSVSKITKKVIGGGEQAIYVFFSEAVGTSALSKDNYYFVDTSNPPVWKKVSNTPEFYDGNKVVRIELTDDEVGYLNGTYGVTVMNVKDLADNAMVANVKLNAAVLAYNNGANAPTVEKTEATSTTTVAVTFDQYLTDVDATAFLVNGVAPVGMALSTNDDGNTVVTLTANDDNKFAYDKVGGTVAIDTDPAKVANIFGVNVADTAIAAAGIDDKIKPEVAEDGISTMDVNNDGKIDHIKVEFTEAMNYRYVSIANFEVAGYDISDAYASTTDPTAAAARTGATVGDSAFVYITVDQKDDPDGAVLPGVKIKGTLKDVAGNEFAVSTDATTPIDGVTDTATATATLASKKVVFTFPAAVYTDTGATKHDVVIGDFTVTDLAASDIGAATLTVSSDKKTVTITFAGTVSAGDTVEIDASDIYDAAGNAVRALTATF